MIGQFALGHQHLVHFIVDLIQSLVHLLGIGFHIKKRTDILDAALPSKLLHDLIDVLLHAFLVLVKLVLCEFALD